MGNILMFINSEAQIPYYALGLIAITAVVLSIFIIGRCVIERLVRVRWFLTSCRRQESKRIVRIYAMVCVLLLVISFAIYFLTFL